MEFIKFTAEQYRELTEDELETRRAEVLEYLNDADSKVPVADLVAEKDMLVEERKRRDLEIELRNAKVKTIEGGAGKVIERSKANTEGTTPMNKPEDVFATEEYTRAFYDFVTQGKKIPAEFRSDAVTATSDTKAVIPTNLFNQIIEKMDTYGEIFAKVTKLNVKGGIEIPIMDIKPEARWVAETDVSEKQKLEAKEKITFTYHELECVLAQTRLSSYVTLGEFQAKFPQYAAEAMVKALEAAIVAGDGNGKPLGITVDPRVENIVTISADEMNWVGWHKNVKAKMPKAYRNGEFIMAQSTFDSYIDGMVDSTGQPVARTNYGINGEEAYRFLGKNVFTVEENLITDFDSASDGDVIAIFATLSDYAINSNKQLEITKWVDHDKRTENTGAYMICDGKLVDPHGVIIIKKGAAKKAAKKS